MKKIILINSYYKYKIIQSWKYKEIYNRKYILKINFLKSIYYIIIYYISNNNIKI